MKAYESAVQTLRDLAESANAIAETNSQATVTGINLRFQPNGSVILSTTVKRTIVFPAVLN